MQTHFIGIGGIGVSAVARLFLRQGQSVSGSDRETDSPVIKELARLGARIYRGHKASQVPIGAELVIHTTAIDARNPELAEAKRRGLTILSYPQALGRLAAGKYTIAVAGTHGKTTTTAMLADILVAGKFDPTVIVGSLIRRGRRSPTNLLIGQSRYFLVEACEYGRAFLNLALQALIITNIDNDHLDYYRDLADIQLAFAELAAKVPADGFLICDRQNPRLQPVLSNARCLIIDYRQMKVGFRLKVPGEHNLANAQAAAAAAAALGIGPATAFEALTKFTGAWRRFEYLGQMKNGALIYDDYAHHPTEIKATLAAALDKFPRRRIIVVFQPHLYSRTKLLLDEFAVSFAAAGEVIVTDIYAARERRDPTVNGERLAAAIGRIHPRVSYQKTFVDIAVYLRQIVTRGDVIITMGAGNVFVLAKSLRYTPLRESNEKT